LKVGKRQVLVILIMTILGFLVMDLNARIWELTRKQALRDDIAAQVTHQAATYVYLETRVAWATSPAMVPEIVRPGQHLSMPGDIVIVPLTPVGRTPVAQTQAQATQEPVHNWQVWMVLFFGE
jgi:hypothetical protein